MNSKLRKQINILWRDFETILGEAYNSMPNGDESAALRDYAPNQSMHNRLAILLAEETKAERQHRGTGSSYGWVAPMSNETAAKLILLENVVRGSELTECPSATLFLICRQAAIEAQVLGYLIRKHTNRAWRDAILAMDYAKIMEQGNPKSAA